MRAAFVRLSQPLKAAYAKETGLDLADLMSASAYKEVHRKAMVRFGESMREKSPQLFAELAVATAPADARMLVVVDARRGSDLGVFLARHGPRRVLTVRLRASDDARAARGWVFTAGIDDEKTECGLDHLEECDWDFVVNNGDDADDGRALTAVTQAGSGTLYRR